MTPHPSLRVVLRIGVTLAVVLLAVAAGRRLWAHYETEPWTRDGRVRADIVQVAPDVSGLVTEVLVRDNEPVAAGTPLFRVDRPRYRLAVAQAEAAVAAQRVQLAQARREAQRNRTLGDLVAGEVREQGACLAIALREGLPVDAALRRRADGGETVEVPEKALAADRRSPAHRLSPAVKAFTRSGSTWFHQTPSYLRELATITPSATDRMSPTFSRVTPLPTSVGKLAASLIMRM